jgi:hypothetical protein
MAKQPNLLVITFVQAKIGGMRQANFALDKIWTCRMNASWFQTST